MGKIHVLTPEVFNCIAAGEVVERPASVVKELVENSLDAGATSIVIEIQRGGKQQIKVVDNGVGIEKEDLVTAFLPHATSKVATIEDLSKIATLGFRGEALASIAAVADVKVISKPHHAQIGASIDNLSGQWRVEDSGSPDGTYFYVSDLFAKIPARAKFLEKDFQEEAAITDLIARLILANPTVSFRYLADGKKIYQSYGRGKEDAISCIYGHDVLQQLIPITAEFCEIKLSGYIGRESFSKPNRTYQTLIVDGRYVANATVSNAVYYAYADRLMKRQYPFYVLYLEIPVTELDVNVHPNKLDVRFKNKNNVFTLVNTAVAQALATQYEVPRVQSSEISPSDRQAVRYSETETTRIFESSLPSSKPSGGLLRSDSEIFARASEILKENARQKEQTSRLEMSDAPLGEEVKDLQKKEVAAERDLKIDGKSQYAEQLKMETLSDEADSGCSDYGGYEVIGVAFSTYLIVQRGDELLWIDQHAAHERLLYDVFKADADKEIGWQPLLVPYVFNVGAKEDAWLGEHLFDIKKSGVDVELFGDGCYRIVALAGRLTEMNMSAFVEAILGDLTGDYNKLTSDLLRDRLMQEACKAAVKGGDQLSDDELSIIMRKIAETGATLMCPHGRPIVVKIEKRTVEKWFKRIV